MNPLDVVVVVILVASVGYGLYRGFIMEVFSLVAVILAFFAANFGHHLLMPSIVEHVDSEGLARFISYFLMFSGVSFLVMITGLIVRRLMKAVLLGWLDRLAGGALGLVRGTVISLILLALATAFLDTDNPTLRESQVAPQAVVLTEQILRLTPESVWETFEEKRRKIMDWAEEAQQGAIGKASEAATSAKEVPQAVSEAASEVLDEGASQAPPDAGVAE